jgi:rhamnosyltransferase
VNLLLDVGFNREVGLDAALYWTKEPGNLAALIQRADGLSDEECEAMGRMARDRIRQAYSWPYIAGRYLELWLGQENAVR